MEKQIKKQIQFVLEDDNEMLRAALKPGSDLDEENKRMNRELICRHKQILAKLDSGEKLTKEDLKLIRYANEVHVNDEDNLAGHHEQVVKLDEWLDNVTEMTRQEAMEVNVKRKAKNVKLRNTIVFRF